MAHLREIYVPDCQQYGCKSRATVSLYSTRNERHGDYCKAHGKAAERRLQRQEEETARLEADLEHGGLER